MSDGKNLKTVGESEEVAQAAVNAFAEHTFDNPLPEDAPEAVKQVVAKGQKVICVDDPYEEMEQFWFRRPTSKELNKFIETSGFRKKPLIGMKQLLNKLALHPAPDALAKRIDDKPMLCTAIYEKINEALGGAREFDVKTFWSNSG